MVDATSKFFAGLDHDAHQPLLEKISGSLRFDLSHGKELERWRVDVKKGDVAVSHRAGAADCTLRASRTLFDGIASGRENATAAVLRGALVVDGDLDLLIAFQRIFPSPPRGVNATPSERVRSRKVSSHGR